MGILMDISQQHPIQKSLKKFTMKSRLKPARNPRPHEFLAASHKERQGLLPVATAGVHRGAVADHIGLQLPKIHGKSPKSFWLRFF